MCVAPLGKLAQQVRREEKEELGKRMCSVREQLAGVSALLCVRELKCGILSLRLS